MFIVIFSILKKRDMNMRIRLSVDIDLDFSLSSTELYAIDSFTN